MARRGDELREHILYTAKNAFLELGFERTSMDVIANKAATSKRTLYAHFESKEKLYLEIIELVRKLFLGKLKHPHDYAVEPGEALTLFCGKYLTGLLFAPTIQWCRVSLAETARFPEAATRYFDVLFLEVQKRVAGYLEVTFTLSPETAAAAAQHLLAQVTSPHFERALFGLDPLTTQADLAAPLPEERLRPIRQVVIGMLTTLTASPER